MRTRLVVAWKPEVFSHEREAKILVKRRNAREPLGAHVRSFERANPIRSRHWGFCFRFWHGNLTNGFWLDRHVQKDLTCAPRGSLAFRLFASSPHVRFWARKHLGSRVGWLAIAAQSTRQLHWLPFCLDILCCASVLFILIQEKKISFQNHLVWF